MQLPDPETRGPAGAPGLLSVRSRVLQAIRQFFTDRDFIEVETPVLLSTPALELHIDAVPAEDGYLRTSPELHMKRLLAAGHTRIFQMGPCFRKGELGPLHNPEYTMLEWYRAGADYRDIIVDTKSLITHVATRITGGTDLAYGGREIHLSPLWDYVKVRDAFVQYAGWDPVSAFDADRFDTDLVTRVEPALPRDRPVILAEYPAEAAALARVNPGDPATAERWELYISGMELVNAFSELADPDEQRARFVACAEARRQDGRPVYPLDEEFLDALRYMPESAGAALGVDRLVMLLTDSASLDSVLPFRSDQ